MGYQTMRFSVNLTGVSERGLSTVSVSAYFHRNGIIQFQAG